MTRPRHASFIVFNHADAIPVRSAATAQSKGRSESQKLARSLSLNLQADRYRSDNRRDTLGNSQTENARVCLYALRRHSYLDKKRCDFGPANVKALVIVGQSIARSGAPLATSEFQAFRSLGVPQFFSPVFLAIRWMSAIGILCHWSLAPSAATRFPSSIIIVAIVL